MISEDDYGALQLVEERERRRNLLSEPHMAALCGYVQSMESQMDFAHKIPSFDPCDGGINARALFLLETPGRKADHSGFVVAQQS